MIATLLVCATIVVYDGDSFHCNGQMMRLLGSGVPGVVGVDTPELGGRAKCAKERKMALLAKRRLEELMLGKNVTIEFYGVRDKTPSHRPLVNVFDDNGDEIGAKLLKEGFAREWRPGHRNDWCD